MKKAVVATLLIFTVFSSAACAAVQVSSLDDLSRVATKIADIFDIGGKTVAVVDGQSVIQDWYFHEGVKGVVFQPSITTYREYIYHGVTSEEFSSTGEPMRETNLFDYTGKLRVVVPELYQKITLRTLKDAELLVKQWGAWPQFSDDGQSASVFIESDWVVSDGFVATRTDEVSGSVTTYQAGEIVPRGVVTLKQAEQR